MTCTKLLGVGVLLATVTAGCGDKGATPKPESGNHKGAANEDVHVHGKGPNGGVVFDFGRYHAEFTVDHPKKECTVLLLAGDNEKAKPLPVAASEFTVTTKATKTKEGTAVPPMTITMKPVDEKEGKASKFVGTDPGLGNVADFEGTATGVIGGRPSSGEFKE